MYVRWKKRLRKRASQGEPSYLLSAALTESHRVNGKPRQRTIAYLGSIRNECIDLPFCLPRRDFWQRVTTRLDALDLSASERATIEDVLGRVVPRPSEEEIAAAEVEFAQYRQTLRALMSAVRR